MYRPFSSCLPSLDQTLDRVTFLLVVLFFSVLAANVHASDADSDGVLDDTAWVQVGADIVGEAEGDHSGSSIKLSAVGDAIAIGARWNADGGSRAGQVRIYGQDGNTADWFQRGEDIDGAENSWSGEAIALSDNGRIVAISAPSFGPLGSPTGEVRIYGWTGEVWRQAGQTLIGAGGSNFGQEVALSADGTLLAIAAARYSDESAEGEYQGAVHTYLWSGDDEAWQTNGQLLTGAQPNQYFGEGVSMSRDGTHLAVGSQSLDDDEGAVQVFTRDEDGWAQRGQTIEIVGAGGIGSIIQLSGDGEALAISAPSADFSADGAGRLYVYRWDETAEQWVAEGSPIDGDAESDFFSDAVAIASDGRRLAASSKYGQSSRGYTKVFDWNETALDWVQVGDTIVGEAAFDYSGWSVAMTPDGDRLAIGSAQLSTGSGLVRVFEAQIDNCVGIANGDQLDTDDDGIGDACDDDIDGDTVDNAAEEVQGTNPRLPGDQYEPNDRLVDAEPLAVGALAPTQSNLAKPFDVDWYKFSARVSEDEFSSEPATLELQLQPLGDGISPEVRFFDESGLEITAVLTQNDTNQLQTYNLAVDTGDVIFARVADTNCDTSDTCSQTRGEEAAYTIWIPFATASFGGTDLAITHPGVRGASGTYEVDVSVVNNGGQLVDDTANNVLIVTYTLPELAPSSTLPEGCELDNKAVICFKAALTQGDTIDYTLSFDGAGASSVLVTSSVAAFDDAFSRQQRDDRYSNNTVDDRIQGGETTSDDIDGDGRVAAVDNCPEVANADQSDLDGDSLGDACDADDDGDQVVDSTDNCPLVTNADQLDTDLDSEGDACDTDDDGDGVLDDDDDFSLDPDESVDSDDDGIGDNSDADDDNDGSADDIDNCPLTTNSDQADNDLDGQGDACDADDDDDGVLDDDDDLPFDGTESVDTDNDGIGDNKDPDDDDDGVPDTDDDLPLDANESVDTDGDGIGNNSDPDDDNDGVPDTDDDLPLDASDSVDTDGDGIGNTSDPDDDGDDVLDDEDAFPLVSLGNRLDTDGDGAPDDCDENCQATGMTADADDDGDGVADADDDLPLDANESVDTDGDGIGNNSDPDDDGDGVPDTDDDLPLDATESVDTDGDGVGNDADTDDDGDGVSDDRDTFPLVALGDRLDTDGDGAPDDCDEDCQGLGMTADADDDGDGVLDVRDGYPLISLDGRRDTDGDGFPDDCDSVCEAEGMTADADDDGDGVDDSNDAFSSISLDGRLDTDGDGRPNECDEACQAAGMAPDKDDDGDGVLDDRDGFPLISLNGRLDTDGDGIPNECDTSCQASGMTADTDDDADGVADDSDAFPLDPAETEDSDGDGVGDNADALPNDPSETTDQDGDGVGDNSDNCASISNVDQMDTDGDGLGNICDADDDSDGVSDEEELANGTDPLDPLDPLSCGSGCFTFDLDGDGSMGALTDGLLAIRYLFGFEEEALTTGATSSEALRFTGDSIATYIEGNLLELDIDGDGAAGPLTDGLLLIRYLFGFEGESLVAGAIGTDATRSTAESIEEYIEQRSVSSEE